LFGVAATKMVLSKVYKKYILAEQKSKFSNWRALRAIDLSPVSGLNCNGIEMLRKGEELEKYERGIEMTVCWEKFTNMVLKKQ
jgi:hypothetical protein